MWRYVEGAIVVLRREGDGYEESDASVCLPGFPITRANDLLGQRLDLGETELIRTFQMEIRT